MHQGKVALTSKQHITSTARATRRRTLKMARMNWKSHITWKCQMIAQYRMEGIHTSKTSSITTWTNTAKTKGYSAIASDSTGRIQITEWSSSTYKLRISFPNMMSGFNKRRTTKITNWLTFFRPYRFKMEINSDSFRQEFRLHSLGLYQLTSKI